MTNPDRTIEAHLPQRRTVADNVFDVWDRMPWVRAAVWAILYQGLLTVVGRLFELSMSPWGDFPFLADLFGHTSRWDSFWYEMIVRDGYAADPSTVAFYPLFPLLVWLLDHVFFGVLSLPALGILVNTIALAAALRALSALVAEIAPGRANEKLAALLLLSSPVAFTFHAFYTEAIFIALSLWAYRFARQQLWWAMGLTLAFTTSARLTGILVVGLCGLEFLRAKGWRPRRFITPQLAWFLLAPLGLVAYGVHCWYVYGNPLAMIDNVRASTHWTYHVLDLNIFATLAREAGIVLNAFLGTSGTMTNAIIFYDLLPLLSLSVLLVASIGVLVLRGRDGIPLAGFGLVAIVMLSLNSNLRSVHRYVMVVFVLYLAAIMLVDRHPRTRSVLHGLVYAGILLQGWWYYLYVTSSQLVV